jgi:hypothetical protein
VHIWIFGFLRMGLSLIAIFVHATYMLAQIAEEIHAPDRAAQDTNKVHVYVLQCTGEGGHSDYQLEADTMVKS